MLWVGPVGCEFAVDYNDANAGMDVICDKPFQARGGVGEIAVFIEVDITGVSE
jgi:hypothetical protein